MITHVACIMDGNRRWAQRRSLVSIFGHKAGVDALKRVVAYCVQKKIPYLSLYAFSLENLKRTQEEKSYLFSVLPTYFSGLADELQGQNVKLQCIGDRKFFPPEIVDFFSDIEQKTADCTGLQLQLLFCYGGQQEIVAAAKEFAKDVEKKSVIIDHLTEKTFDSYLWTKDIPYPDIIIRTGGYKRLSNFLLFQAAYAELYFLDILWPDVDGAVVEKVIEDFELRKRNFGV